MKRLQALYDQEINFSISCFWDAGFDVKLGDEANGYREEGTVYGIDKAIDLLVEMVGRHFPIESND